MNKSAIKNFAIWARRKLISDITYKAGLLGITDKGIKDPLVQSTKEVQFFDIGTKEPYQITGKDIEKRAKLVNYIKEKEEHSDYSLAYKTVIEEVAYTWFNRLIAIRFMEVNEYLPSKIRVLSSQSKTKLEPDIVTMPFDTDLEYTEKEKTKILSLINENKQEELFKLLFIKQCNALNTVLPALFEKTTDFTELLLNISFTDKEGLVYKLVNDIEEEDFKEAVEIIGWMYQYYNTEPKDEVFALLKNNVKITKENIPAVTQLFTPDWIVRYMVENSLGRLWVEGHPNEDLKSNWKYYLDEAEQEDHVKQELENIRKEYEKLRPEDIKVIDPCMGSAHILVYGFDVLLQIYETQGHTKRDAAKLIVENNLYGLDIDDRAYQLAYFAVMMKGRQYDRRFLNREITPNLHSIKESNMVIKDHLKYFGNSLNETEKSIAIEQINYLVDTFIDAKEYGSILNVNQCDWELLSRFLNDLNIEGQMNLDSVGAEETQNILKDIFEIAKIMARKYDVVITNPPYMGGSGMNSKVSSFVKKNYPDSKSDLFAVFMEKWNTMVNQNGFNCMVTMQSWMFLSSFEKMRKNILSNINISNLMHMENMVLGIAFGTAVTNFLNCKIKGYKGTYNQIKLNDLNKQGIPKEFPISNNRFAQVSTENFSKIPGSPIAYWVSENFISAFDYGTNLKHVATSMVSGNKTADNDKYLRQIWEINSKNIDNIWYKYAKGGQFRKWYGNIDFVVNWSIDARNNYKKNSSACIIKEDYWFKEGFTYTDLTSKAFSARLLNNDMLFDMSGPGILFDNDNLNYSLGVLNSNVANEYFKTLNTTFHYKLNDLNRIPIIQDLEKKNRVNKLVENNINASKTDWDSFETSWDFEKHPLVDANLPMVNNHDYGEKHPLSNVVKHPKYDLYYATGDDVSDSSIESAYEIYRDFTERQFNKLKSNEEELNRIFIEIYGLEDELTPDVEDKDVTVYRVFDSKDAIPDSMKGSRYALTKQDVIKSFISYAVGCMFGRYSLDVEGLAYAGGDWDDSKYSIFTPDKENIIPITDEEYFKDDIVGLFVSFVKKVYGENTLEENLEFIADALDIKGNTPREIIRNYFIKDFFKDHVKTYQKRPIYWMFDSGKANGFKALIYLHRYDENTIGNLRIDYLHRIQRVYDNEIKRMQDTIDNSQDAREKTLAQKRKEKLIKQLKETKEYDEKIAHLALARISLDLDDGVKVNYEKLQTDKDGKKLQVLAKI